MSRQPVSCRCEIDTDKGKGVSTASRKAMLLWVEQCQVS